MLRAEALIAQCSNMVAGEIIRQSTARLNEGRSEAPTIGGAVSQVALAEQFLIEL
jgi:hypothetical protein